LYLYLNKNIMRTYIIPVLAAPHPDVPVANGHVSYLIGGIVAILIMGYLIYTLLRPDKF
jgi:K+-transporting ATPase KdpF subunit